MENCNKCNLPASFPNITLEKGVCTFCRIHDQTTKERANPLGEDKLLEILTSAKGEKYDCLVALSGGKDSSYILYYIVSKLKLKPLAVTFDNGYSTDYAQENIRNLCSKLGVDLEIGKSTPHRFKHIRESWYINKYWELGMFGFCGNCENNLRSFVINTAEKYKIKHILWGSTDYEDYPILKENSPTFRNSFSVSANIFTSMKKFVKFILVILLKGKSSIAGRFQAIFHYIKYLYYNVLDNISTKAPHGRMKYDPFLEVSFKRKKTKAIYFYDYVKYDPIEQMRILSDEIGWKAPSGRELKMDCNLHIIGSYFHYKQTGITDTGFKLSTLVRNGLLNKSDAILKEKQEVKYLQEIFPNDQKKEVLQKIHEIIDSHK